MKSILTTSLALALCVFAQAAQAFLAPTNAPPTVQVAWDPITDPTVVNVNIYYGVGPGQYTNVINVGLTTNATLTLPGRGVVYYLAATCVASGGLESGFSQEVSYMPPNVPKPPSVHPLIILHVQSAPTPTGQFADAGMDWSLNADQSVLFYKLRVEGTGTTTAAQAKAMQALRALPPLPGH